ncbi:MAG: hypothetical protein WCG84_04050 [Candidatus Moraniibacteriota bacterium]
MSLTKDQQVHQLIQQSERILVLIPANATGDHYAAATAWAHFFTGLEKKIDIASSSIDSLRTRYDFLTPPPTSLTSLSGLRDFVLSFNTKHNHILGNRTEIIGDEYKIFVTPEKGSLDPRDFSILPVHFAYDCLIILGSPNRAALGSLAEENPDIFYEIPIINIDCHPDNEQFGQINLIDLTASSLAEISLEVFGSFDPNALTQTVAECLLTGLMIATESFQKKTTTPKAFQLAAKLIDLGADQQRLVQYLFKTQPLHILKLWGHIMQKMQWNETLHLLSGVITIEDLDLAQAARTDIPLVLEKIITHTAPDTLLMILFESNQSTIDAFLHSRVHTRLELLQQTLIHDAVSITLDSDTLTLTFNDTSADTTQKLLLEKLGK